MKPSAAIRDVLSGRLQDHAAYLAATDALDALVADLDLARNLVKGLFSMIDRETWRASGGDDGQGHFEGDYHAAKIEEEIKSWET